MGNSDDQTAIRILHISPHHEDDGIAVYQEQYLAGMEKMKEVKNAFFETSTLTLRAMDESEREEIYNKLKKELTDYDIVHIQHEFGLFAQDEFKRLVDIAKGEGKKVVVSVHLSPSFAVKKPKLGGLGPRSWAHYLRQYRYHNIMTQRHIAPFRQADLLLVHNDGAKKALLAEGIDEKKIIKIVHPVPVFPDPPKSDLLARRLHKKDGDIIYATVGMMHRFKGTMDAVKALKFLPDNYKLAIVGGMHPISDDVAVYNKVCDLIDTLGLKDRVYITGFIKDQHEMNALIRECDICVYPYDGVYYAQVSSGSINLALSNNMPVIAYPTAGFKEIAEASDGAVVLTDTFAYYEMVREIERIDIAKQRQLSKAYAEKMAWPKLSKELVAAYQSIMDS